MSRCPFPLFPALSLTLPPAYLGSIDRYALFAAAGNVTVTSALPFNKRQKSVHRCTIAGHHGPMQLTAPIAKPPSMTRARWADIALSPQARWWHVHRTALESEYGRTPYFEFYADDLLPLYADFPAMTAAEFDRLLELKIVGLLGLPAPRYVDEGPAATLSAPGADTSGCILDLLFERGPEAAFDLRDRALQLFQPAE